MMFQRRWITCLFWALWTTVALCGRGGMGWAAQADRPNVILIMTDDQGYGDIAAHGNPVLKTPNLDRLYSQAIRMTDFHVDPTCSPTRSALLSGRYSTKTGVWHTICGRSLMAADELTLAEIFKANGYATGMYGKWHLGDAYPLRPQDQGFDDVVCHGGGGVGQTPDYFDNDYFDDTYWRNGQTEKFEGYCTDVWFREATRFISQHQDEPFFVYLATNAPHGPYLVDEKYRQPYDQQDRNTSRFFGMIANIDENVGRLRSFLKENNLDQNTLLIFMTDNGTAQGEGVFNADMRGKKGSEYEGGHRVPCFFYWPKGDLSGGRDVNDLSAHIDMRPTLVELCGLQEPHGPESDGTSLAGVLQGTKQLDRQKPIVVHSQRILHPEKWRKSAVMYQQWRLVNGKELFNLVDDPSQSHDLASEETALVQELRDAYDTWWDSLQPAIRRTIHVEIGSDQEKEARLTAHDWLLDNTPWHQNAIRNGAPQSGPWAVRILQPGRYRIELTRWPRHLQQSMEANSIQLRIQGQTISKTLTNSDTSAEFEVQLEPGETRLESTLASNDGKQRGAYYAYISLIEAN